MARGKRKRLNITKDDRVIGVRPRDQRDLFAGCNEPGQPWFQRDAHEFEKIYCRLCKNADCLRAKGAVSPWQTRMAEQVDYLLNNPQFSSMTSEDHKRLGAMAFENIRQRMERLEIARERQDWEIPEDSEGDGYDRVAPSEVTDQFDDAVRSLAEAKGTKAPDLTRTSNEENPAHFQGSFSSPPEVSTEEPPPPDEEIEYETQYPSSDGTRTYRVALTKDGAWACECKAFQHKQQCKHVVTVRSWYEDQLQQAEQSEQPTPEPPATQPDPRIPVEQPYNTPVPQGGIMIGNDSPSELPVEPDPWEIPKENVVQPGAVVTLKGSKK